MAPHLLSSMYSCTYVNLALTDAFLIGKTLIGGIAHPFVTPQLELEVYSSHFCIVDSQVLQKTEAPSWRDPRCLRHVILHLILTNVTA